MPPKLGEESGDSTGDDAGTDEEEERQLSNGDASGGTYDDRPEVPGEGSGQMPPRFGEESGDSTGDDAGTDEEEERQFSNGDASGGAYDDRPEVPGEGSGQMPPKLGEESGDSTGDDAGTDEEEERQLSNGDASGGADDDGPEVPGEGSGQMPPKLGEESGDSTGDDAGTDEEEEQQLSNGDAFEDAYGDKLVVAKDGDKQPRRIGGRRNGNTPKDASTPQSKPGSRPELVCRQLFESRRWEVVLSAEDECRIKKITYADDTELKLRNGECRLPLLGGRLTVVYEDKTTSKLSLCDDKAPLIFKMRKYWEGDGRRVKGIAKGHYIVIAPETWKRTGVTRVEPQLCTDEHFLAHYFFSDGDKDIDRFRDQSKIVLTQSVLQLKGESVFDDSGDGNLFVGKTPTLTPQGGISWACVGEEAKNGWKGSSFRPEEREISDVLKDRQGRFFVRVYDNNVELVDSGQFRYLRDIEEIRVNGHPYAENTLLLPPPTGHPPTEVRLIGVDGGTGGTIRSVTPTKETSTRGDTIVVEPRPILGTSTRGDRVSCTIESDTGSVDVVLDLPRAWWRMELDEIADCKWRDKPLVMTRQEFREHAFDGAVIRLRLPQRIKSARFGFDRQLDKELTLWGKNDGRILLSEFEDYTQIREHLNEDAPFNMECNGEKLTLIWIAADVTVTVGYSVSSDEKPCARVKTPGGGWRRGRGFSYGELGAAGGTVGGAICRSVPIDRRRQTIHLVNVETLSRLYDA